MAKCCGKVDVVCGGGNVQWSGETLWGRRMRWERTCLGMGIGVGVGEQKSGSMPWVGGYNGTADCLGPGA